MQKTGLIVVASLLCLSTARAEESKSIKLPEWLDKISLKGDGRYRVEYTDDEALPDARTRDRFRFRLALDARVADNVVVGAGLTTGENGDPRAGNQTLDGEYSRKSAYFDLYFIDWAITKDLHAIGGKMKTPFFRPGQSLFWDNDINPEGIAATYGVGSFFSSAYMFWVDENVVDTGTTAGAADTKQYGAQFGINTQIGESKLTAALMYSDLAAAQGRRPFFSNTATGSNGNTVTGTGTSAVLTYDFQIVQASAQWDMRVGSLPVSIWADVAHNFDPDQNDNAWTTGFMLGKAAAKNSFEGGLSYVYIGKDALFGQVIDSDFVGVTDTASIVLRLGYAPIKNVSINVSLFDTQRNVKVGTEDYLRRGQFDINARF